MSDDSASNENDTSTRKVKGYQVELVEILDKIAENCENLDAVGSFSVVYEEE
jgi:hypothetical protein